MTDSLQSSLLGLQGAAGAAQAPSRSSTAALAQEDFLRLMTTQLQSQDPFAPMESGEFLSQFAQFGTVSGIQELQNSFAELSSSLKSLQALQASSLVGRSVLVESGAGLLPAGGTLDGAVTAPGAAHVQVSVHDLSGQMVQQLAVPVDVQGRAEFSWDGQLAGGGQALPGVYGISAQGLVGGESKAFTTSIKANVQSVTLGQGGAGLQLNLAGLGSVAAGDVIEIM